MRSSNDDRIDIWVCQYIFITVGSAWRGGLEFSYDRFFDVHLGRVRITQQQNLAFRWVPENALYEVWGELNRIGLGD